MSLDKLKEYRKQFVVEGREPIFKYGDIVRVKTDDENGLDYLIIGISLIVSNGGYTYDTITADGGTFFSYEEDLVLSEED